jgi:K+-sensing histidine kinase KdpD
MTIMDTRKPYQYLYYALFAMLCAVLTAGILYIDILLPLGVAVGVMYVAVVLLSLWLPRWVTVFMAIVCSVLTIGVYFYNPTIPELWKSTCNRILVVSVIWVTAFLGLQRKKATEERMIAVKEREKALDELRILSGIIPICASCKKIRGEQGDWKPIEHYIKDHSEAEFSHGICPDCMKTLYPDLLAQEPTVLAQHPAPVKEDAGSLIP